MTSRKWLMGGAVLGLLAGLAITVPAHQGDPFLTAPGVFLGLVFACIGSLVSLSLLFFKKGSDIVAGLCSGFLMMLVVLVLLPLVWPYSKSDGPKPMAGETKDGRTP